MLCNGKFRLWNNCANHDNFYYVFWHECFRHKRFACWTLCCSLCVLGGLKFWGRRLGYLFFGTIGMVVFNVLLWSVPNFISEIGKFFWLLIVLLSLETANTCFATPYVALGIDIAPGYNEQSTLQGYKTVFFILGMVLPSALMMIFMHLHCYIQKQI